MDMTEAEAANDDISSISEEIVDRAYDAMCAELSLWQIVGPLEERRANLPPREFWNAVRVEKEVTAPLKVEPGPSKIFHLNNRANAIACVQWHGLAAALAAVQGELAPTASNTDEQPTGQG